MNKSLRFVLAAGTAVLLLSSASTKADSTVLNPDADTYTRSAHSAGSADVLDIRGFGGSDFVGYIRFDLSPLYIDTISDATFSVYKVAGSRNDGITTGRFANFGLTNALGNTPQNWDEATLAEGNVGAEYTNVVGNLVDFSVLFNLDADMGANVTETVGDAPTASTLTGPDLVTFLNERVDDGGLVTMISIINASGRGYGYGSKENSDPSLWPTLSVTYTGIPEPTAAALACIGGLGLFMVLRRRR
jgi:hypothetical protein